MMQVPEPNAQSILTRSDKLTSSDDTGATRLHGELKRKSFLKAQHHLVEFRTPNQLDTMPSEESFVEFLCATMGNESEDTKSSGKLVHRIVFYRQTSQWLFCRPWEYQS